MSTHMAHLTDNYQVELLEELGFTTEQIDRLVVIRGRALESPQAQHNRRLAFVRWLIDTKGKFNEFELSEELEKE